MISKINDIDRKIMQLRALGYHQSSIAKEMKVSQAAISQRIEKIRLQSKNIKDFDKTFWKIILGNTPKTILEIIQKIK